MRKLLIACLLAAAPAVAFGENPGVLLMRPPLPQGLVAQTLKPFFLLRLPEQLIREGSAFYEECLAIDIDTEGHVSNVMMLKSSGNVTADAYGIEQAKKQGYEPAKMNGLPTAVRALKQSEVAIHGGGESADPVDPHVACTWDDYDAYQSQAASHPSSASNTASDVGTGTQTSK